MGSGKTNFKRRRRVFPYTFFYHGVAAEEEFSEEEDGICSSAFSSSNVAGRLKQLNMNMQARSVCSRCEVSDVINFRLELVITPSGLSSEVVVNPACTMTTTSMLPVVGCVGVSVDSYYCSSSSSRVDLAEAVWTSSSVCCR